MARMRAADGAVDIANMPEVARAFKELGKDAHKKLRLVGKDVATFVAADAKSAAYAMGGVAAHVAPSIKPAAGAQFAGVAGGGPAHPAFGGAEFGGRGRPTTQQFQPWRGNGEGAGYFVYPTIRRDLPKIETEYVAGINDLIREVGLA